jgi:recombination protein RecA
MMFLMRKVPQMRKSNLLVKSNACCFATKIESAKKKKAPSTSAAKGLNVTAEISSEASTPPPSTTVIPQHINHSPQKELKQQQKDALTAALARIDKQFGKGTVSQLGSQPTFDISRVISTGTLAVDDALGIGGLPLGRIVEIFGPEASGKTSLALAVVAEAQKLGGKCMFVDAEHALDSEYAKGMGVNLDNLYITQPDCGEDALEIVDEVTRSGAMSVIVVDSVSALVPKSEIEGEMSEEKIGVQARLMSRALRKLTPNVSKTSTILIFINQIRHKIGVMFGSPETTSGGQALKFYASVRLDVRKSNTIKNSSGEPIGTIHKVKVVKNKVGPPFRVAEFSMRFGQGISRANELIDVGVAHGLIEMRGSFYYVNHPEFVNPDKSKLMLGQGRERVVDTLNKDPQLQQRLTALLREHRQSKQGVPDAGLEAEMEEEGSLTKSKPSKRPANAIADEDVLVIDEPPIEQGDAVAAAKV